MDEILTKYTAPVITLLVGVLTIWVNWKISKSVRFENINALIGWNGINQTNNSIADDGVYFYLIKITLGNNRTYKFKGNLTLIK